MGRRTTGGRRLLGALLAWGIVASACADSGGDDPAPIEAGSATDLVVGSAGVIGFDQVSFDGPGSVVAVPVEPPPPDELPASVLAIGTGLDVHLTGEPVGSFEVTLRLPPDPGGDAVPAALHQRDDGGWDIVAGRWDADRRELVILVDEFSWYFPSWFRPIDWIAGVIDGVSDWITGRTDPPHCNDDAPSWASVAPPGGTVHTCLQSNVDDATGTVRAELLFKSNRRGYQTVTIPAGADYVWAEGQPDWARPLLAWFTGTDTDNNLLLPGGQQVSFGFTQPERTSDIVVAAFPTPGTILLDGAAALLAIKGGDVSELITVAMTLNSCVAELIGVDVFAADFSVNRPDWGNAFVDVLQCALDLITLLTETTAGPRALEMVAGADALGLLGVSAATRAEIADDLLAGAQKLGSIAKKATAALQVAGAGVDFVDKIFDNSSDNITADLHLRGRRVTDPRPGDYAVTIDEVAVASGPTPIFVVLDTSGSMAEVGAQGVKIEEAKRALVNFLSSVEPGTPLGLWTYPAAGGTCGNGELRIPIQERDPIEMERVIRTLTADGDTPTAEALLAAVERYEASGYEGGTVLLITDGESTCADPCDTAEQILASGFALSVIGVGFSGDDAVEAEIACLERATDGASLTVDDEEGLSEAITSASRPEFDVVLEHPTRVIADVGLGAGTVDVTATITNVSQADARNVISRIRFTSASPGVAGPVRALGNLAPGASTTVTWTFGAGLVMAGRTVEFDVITVATNTTESDDRSGSVEIVDASGRSDAGEILSTSNLVIMGDSYSAGEGADGYIADTDVQANSCHRSLHTYLAEEFGLDETQIIACSGAVANQITGPDPANNIPSQLDQLAAYSDRPAGPPGAVVMTIGGNDAGFPDLAFSCVAGLAACSESIGGTPSETFLEEHLYADPLAGGRSLAEKLVDVYREVDAVLNSALHVAERGTVAPILIPAYPLPVPTADRGCFSLALVTQPELDFITRFHGELNGVVESATTAARTAGIPVWFVPTSEDAFLPDHTVCDRVPWARSLESLNGAGIDVGYFIDRVITVGWLPAVAEFQIGVDLVGRTVQELFHPNQPGYDAWTRAIVRWSRTDDAEAAVELLEEMTPAEPSIVRTWKTSTIDLGRLDDGARISIQGGTTYPVRHHGFAPGSPVELRMESAPTVLGRAVADADGTIDTFVAVPHDVDTGDHTLHITGLAPDLTPRTSEIPLHRAPAGRSVGGFVLLALALLFLTSAAIAAIRSRRFPEPARD